MCYSYVILFLQQETTEKEQSLLKLCSSKVVVIAAIGSATNTSREHPVEPLPSAQHMSLMNYIII